MQRGSKSIVSAILCAAVSPRQMIPPGDSAMVQLYPIYLEVEGQKAFAILPYAQYLEIEEQLEELEDIRVLGQAKAIDADAPTISLAAVCESYGLDNAEA